MVFSISLLVHYYFSMCGRVIPCFEIVFAVRGVLNDQGGKRLKVASALYSYKQAKQVVKRFALVSNYLPAEDLHNLSCKPQSLV